MLCVIDKEIQKSEKALRLKTNQSTNQTKNKIIRALSPTPLRRKKAGRDHTDLTHLALIISRFSDLFHETDQISINFQKSQVYR